MVEMSSLKFLVDAQLPFRMCAWFQDAGADAIHSSSLPNGNATTDLELIVFADAEQRIVVTKDSDFVNGLLENQRPARLLLISTGNITNSDLQNLIVPLIPMLLREFQSHVFLELRRDGWIIRQ